MPASFARLDFAKFYSEHLEEEYRLRNYLIRFYKKHSGELKPGDKTDLQNQFKQYIQRRMEGKDFYLSQYKVIPSIILAGMVVIVGVQNIQFQTKLLIFLLIAALTLYFIQQENQLPRLNYERCLSEVHTMCREVDRQQDGDLLETLFAELTQCDPDKMAEKRAEAAEIFLNKNTYEAEAAILSGHAPEEVKDVPYRSWG